MKTTGSQVKKPLGKSKIAKPQDKGKKHVALVLHLLQQLLHLQFRYLA